ncbi:MAG: hypothetical protein HYT87_14550 [Nitrospirae bacterium]|nr:hypothetical protein [Nitrospirota bacterium]
MQDSPWTGATALNGDWLYRILICGLAFFLAIGFSGCGLTGKAGRSESAKPPEAVDPGTLKVEAVLPLTVEQAAMLEAVNQGLRSGVRGAGKDAGVLADVLWDEQVVAEGVPAAVRGGVRGGVRGFGEPVGLPGAPARPNGNIPKSKKRQSSDSGDLGIEISAAVPRSILSPGLHALGIRIRVASRPEMVLASTLLRTEVGLGGGVPGTETIVERPVEPGEIQLPDADGDGVSTLMEIVVIQAEVGLEAALLMAADPASAPAPEQAEKVFLVLQKDLKPFLTKQGVPESYELPSPDLTPPDTAVVSREPSVESGQEVVAAFSCNEDFCAYRCSLTGPERFEARPCTSPFVLRLSKDGAYDLAVQAADGFGNADPTPARFSFVVLPTCVPSVEICDGKDNDCDSEIDEGNVCDTTPPETAISVQPSAVSNRTSAGFEFSCTDPVAAPFMGASLDAGVKPAPTCSFFCQLDIGTPSSCASPLTLSLLSDGSHTFSVHAVDTAGNKDPTPATFTWTVDTTPPDTAISDQPPAVSNQTSATFKFTSPDTAATFQCSTDNGTYSACVSPLVLSVSKDAGHTFAVRSIDPAGNTDPTPVSYAWSVDTTAPTVAISSQPSAISGSTTATFTFTCNDSSCTLECSLDTAAFAACTSPKSYTGLSGGSHTFQVQAKDAAGNTGPAASSTWTIDVTPPTFSGLVSATAVATYQINLAWSAATDNVSASSSLVYKICMSTTRGACGSSFVTSYTTSAGATSYSVSGLSTGTSYYFMVKAVDTVNNADANGTERSAMTWGTRIAQAVTNHFGQHACTLLSNGTARCWGDNVYGQLGDGSSVSMQTAPVAVTSLTGAVALSGARNHTCGLLADGSVRCWGKNDFGQLGDGSTVLRSVPTAVSSLTSAVQVAGGHFFSCGLVSGGSVRCWGSDQYGQLGDGSSNNSKSTPVAVSSLTNAIAVASGGYHTCALLPDGTVKCWGWNNYGEIGDGSTVDKTTPIAVSSLTNAVSLAAGGNHSCGLVSDGTVRCWGSNLFGQLGDGTTVDRWTSVAVSTLTNVAAVAGGIDHTCGLLSDGTVKCWGLNGNGQLGDGTSNNSWTPVAVSSLTGAVAVAGGNNFTCSLHSDGWVRCWGINTAGGLGDGTVTERFTPVSVTMPAGPLGAKLPRVRDTAATGASARPFRKGLDGGTLHMCALVSEGTVRCWGGGNVGQLGDGGTTVAAGSPVVPSSLTGVVALATGTTHSCAVTSDGGVKCWGNNGTGQVGDGTTTTRLTPVAVTGLSNAVAIDAGKAHTCALAAEGSVKCWGLNFAGQLGDGTSLSKNTPVAVSTLTGAVAVETGGGYDVTSGHTCALIFDGTVNCWGYGARGALGNGSGINKHSPVAVSSLTNAVSVMAGVEHSCALLADGAARCWGRDNYGQLGDGTTTNASVPVAVTSLTNAIAMAGGYTHTCALLSNGAVKCWGRNNSGQLGDGTTTDSLIPVNVTSLSSVVALGGGEEFTCAMISDGTIKCWGENNLGQIGDGADSPTNKSIPTQVLNFP